MPATFNKVNTFTKNMAEKVFNLASDQIKIALTSVAPVATNNALADLTEIAYTNLSSRNVTTTSSAQASGTYKLTLTDLVLTASGGPVASFRYVVLYDDTAASKQIIGFFDYGAGLVLNDTETFTVDFDGTNGVLTNV